MDRNKLILAMLAAILIAVITTIVVAPVIWMADDNDYIPNTDSKDFVIVTKDATEISTTFTTLNGELVDMGDSSTVEVYFVWGENPGECTKETPKQKMTSTGDFSAEISDLFMPDNTYYFQARSDPEGQGEELSFYVN